MLFSIADEGKRYNDESDVHALSHKIKHDIKILNLSGNVFRPVALKRLLEKVRKNCRLERLIMSKTFSALPKEELLECLSIIGKYINPEYLEELDLSENAISTVLPEPFFDFLTKMSKLKIFKMSNCGLGAIGGKSLAGALAKIIDKTNLEYIDISKNKLDRGASDIGRVLNGFKNLKTIRIQYNTISKDSMDSFIESLRHNVLRHLDLRDNIVSIEGCRSLGKYFVTNNTREILLGDCLIGDDGLKAFLEEASKNLERPDSSVDVHEKNLFILDLSYNDITQDGINILKNYSKKILFNKLMIYGNDFEDCSALVEYVSNNRGMVVYEDPNSLPTNIIDESFLKKFTEIL